MVLASLLLSLCLPTDGRFRCPDTVVDSFRIACTRYGQSYGVVDTVESYSKIINQYYLYYGFHQARRMGPIEFWHYLFEFDVTGVPDTYTVTGARLRFFSDGSGPSADIRIFPSLDVSAESLYKSIDSGTAADTERSCPYGWNNRQLNPAAVAAVAARVQDSLPFCLALHDVEWNPGERKCYIESPGDSAKPCLWVTTAHVGVAESVPILADTIPARRTGWPTLPSCLPKGARAYDAQGRRVPGLCPRPGLYFLAAGSGANHKVILFAR
jgi:hypothetical protein